ncbi:SH3 domain-containing protein [Fusarium keratoplasticum]|uniref:SH3 domain-containing protein n=1 Tax=Fusarium keratoplasticum TaxID=1328300 RepID=A0ACC0RAX2_9HYPO|nr:SH3 domain-containing protein [Fusarium keratoplasticum]KAI8679783.1 SH3 domain-containing protein [Fusarium keratoplasticum]KAI8685870.1 SH3 domain-containing protein [Fusarium keratoplasticum]
MDDVADLVVTPFRDIVDKGRTAVENAGDDKVMLKAAQSLVKEGERALKRIEPLCRKHLDEYGSNFLDALKENDDIANFRSELTELLWEFDDYIELEDFEPEKFAELQGLSRKAAPKIYDILMRMKLEVPIDHDTRSIMTRLSGPQSRPISPDAPPIPPLFPFSDMRKDSASPASVQRSAPESVADSRSVHDPPTVEAATAQLRHLMQTQSGPDEGLYANIPESLKPGPPQGPPPMEPPPRPPSANPWDVKTPPQHREQRFPDDFSFERRAPVAPVESPIEPISPPLSPQRARESPTSRPRPLYMGSDRSSQISNDSRLSPTGAEPSSYERTYSIFPTPRGRYSNSNSIMSTSIPEDVASDRSSAGYIAQLSSRLPPPRTHSLPKSRPESVETNQSSVFDPARTDGVNTPLTEHRGSAVSAADSSPTLGSSELSTLPLKAPPVNNYQGMIEPPQAVRMPEIDNLPIPVETETPIPEHPPNPFAVDCKLNPQSSFYTHKGFCDGAKEILNGGAGVKKTVKAGFASAASIAKCVKCHFELDFNEIDLDVNKAARGNFIKNGIGYRIRFLQKSHLPTRRSDDVMYGCIFCIHQGRTLHASDATVFVSQKALFAHLARHPRPLPAVPGFTVIEEAEVPDRYRNDYDLHFKSPVETHPVVEKSNEICNMPTATSKEAARRMYGQRLLYDRTPALEMVQGARITGIEWPAKYLGEWCMGYHDAVYASVPFEIMRLDPPSPENIKMDGTSPTQVTARWRFNVKDKTKGDWLKFEKDEVITNISYPYQEFWCWSGTNQKGKWGIFPQAFIDIGTLRDFGVGSDRASVISSEKNKPTGGVLSRFSTRKSGRSGRRSSVAGSVGSNEILPPPTPVPGMYGRE